MPVWLPIVLPYAIRGGEAVLVGLAAGAAVYTGNSPLPLPAHDFGAALSAAILAFSAKLLPSQVVKPATAK